MTFSDTVMVMTSKSIRSYLISGHVTSCLFQMLLPIVIISLGKINDDDEATFNFCVARGVLLLNLGIYQDWLIIRPKDSGSIYDHLNREGC